ncbi:MAG: hypothetical protein V3S17_07110 [candidate division Zixibacteria bacterium]
MSESTRKKILYAALVGAIIWGVYNFVPKSQISTTTTSKPVVSRQAPVEATNTTFARIDKTINVADMKLKGWGSDPFRARNKKTFNKKAPKKVWKLTGIVFNDFNPLAIINGKSIGVGDIIEGAKVLKIERKKVVIEYAGNSISLWVSKG